MSTLLAVTRSQQAKVPHRHLSARCNTLRREIQELQLDIGYSEAATITIRAIEAAYETTG
jgi:hypothetical protein